ncbi:MAG: DinB family protein, partial [Phycisphaerales bacterium]|nr:DinB family protein [Phycisphaerales bacterium]
VIARDRTPAKVASTATATRHRLILFLTAVDRTKSCAALDRSEAMQAIDGIRIVLKFSDMGKKYLEEMGDAPLLRPGPWGGITRCGSPGT